MTRSVWILLLAAMLFLGTAPGARLGARTASGAVRAEDFAELYGRCTGFAGTAGSSLKMAGAACEALAFAVEHDCAAQDADMLRAEAEVALDALDSDRREELPGNLDAIAALIAQAFASGEPDAVFEDAGAVDAMRALLGREGALEDWLALEAALPR